MSARRSRAQAAEEEEEVAIQALNGVSEGEEEQPNGGTDLRPPIGKTPRVSLDYFFLGDSKPIQATKSAAKMTTKQLRTYLREASIASTGNRVELLARYHA